MQSRNILGRCRKLMAVMLGCGAVVLAAGCAKKTEERVIQVSPPVVVQSTAAPSPVLVFVAQAALGQSAQMTDPYFGGEAEVVLDQEYTSASGKTCRQFSVRKPKVRDPGERYFACNDGTSWHMAGVY